MFLVTLSNFSAIFIQGPGWLNGLGSWIT